MEKSNLNNASNLIVDHFESLQQKAFTEHALRNILKENRLIWGISKLITTKKFVLYLIENKILLKKELKASDETIKPVYIVSGFDNLTLFTALKKDAYYSHFTAMYLNGLTLQIPKTHYLNYEHYYEVEKGKLNQESIDHAFSKPQRKSSTSYTLGGSKVFIVNGKYANRIGVNKRFSENQSFYFTNLERTLIDIAIRSVYSGGVFEVLHAYKAAKKHLDVLKLKDYLKKLDYTYPYHQAVGFYLDRAGYGKEEVKHFAENIEFNFYLTYNIRKMEFDENWKIFYPKGF